MYTLREFRAHTKQAFDDADSGHEVVITRGKQKFQLVSLVNGPSPGSNFESSPAKPPIIKTKQDAEKAVKPLIKDTLWGGPLFRDKKKSKL